MAVSRAEAAITRKRFGEAAAAAREALATDLQTFLPDCDGQWVAERRHECEALRLRALEALAAAGVGLGGHELGDGRGRRQGRGRRRAVPRVCPPRADGGPRGGRQPRRGAARVRAPARAAARRARHVARGGGDGRPSAAAARRARPGHRRRAAPRSSRGRRRSRSPSSGTRSSNRGAELAFLESCWAQARGGTRQLVMLAGDAGIGKTRAAAELSRRAHDGGRRRALRALRRGDAGALPAGRGDGAGLGGGRAAGAAAPRGWAPTPPSWGSCSRSWARRPTPRTSAAPTPTPGGCASSTRWPPCSPRWSGTAPAVVVFDDLHWADRPTLQLLRHLVRSPLPARTLFVGTYRETELAGGHPLQELVGDLRREGTLKRLELEGLGEADVGLLIAALGVESPSPGFVAALHGETEGNPFFIEEVVGHLRAEGERVGRGRHAGRGGRARGRARGHLAAAAATRRRRAPGRRGRGGDRARVRLRAARARARRHACPATRWSPRWRRRCRRGCSARPVASATTRSPTRWCGRRSTTASPSCAARGCTGASARRSSTCSGGDVDGHLPQLAHHFAPRRAAGVDRSARSTSRSPPPGAPTG